LFAFSFVSELVKSLNLSLEYCKILQHISAHQSSEISHKVTMTIEFTVFKGTSSGAITESKTTLLDLLPNQVLLQHTHSGVCGTDAHFVKQDMVLGHEGVGVAKAIGSAVKDFKV
jgi:Zn-dependent alcohol dehydrogenase